MIVTDKTRESFDKALASLKNIPSVAGARYPHPPVLYVQETVGAVMVFDACAVRNVPPYAVAVLCPDPEKPTTAWLPQDVSKGLFGFDHTRPDSDGYYDAIIAFLTGECGL